LQTPCSDIIAKCVPGWIHVPKPWVIAPFHHPRFLEHCSGKIPLASSSHATLRSSKIG
jgi:hypothetical protein